MKKILQSILLFGAMHATAQVGIGVTTPQGALDVTSTNDGLLIPRIALVNTTTATVTTPTASELVYNTATAGDVTPGFYYWNGTVWVRLSTGGSASNDWGVTGNAGTNPATNFAGTTDAQPFAIRTNNTEKARVTPAGQLALGTTNPQGALDINSNTQGVILPRVALTALNVEAPVVNPAGGGLATGTLVWNTATAGTLPNNVSPGMYYWNGTRWVSLAGSPGGLDWSIIGNGGIDGGVTGTTTPPVSATLGTHFLGTYDNTNMDIRTNGLHAARFSSLGEFFIGDTETVLPGDLMNGVSEGNAAFPWAVNGYTNQNGAGVYGQVTGGTTNFAGVQGEYNGTSANGAGVRGIINNTTPGTGFSGATPPIAGVKGDGAITATSAGAYKFGVAARGGFSRRSGAVFGDDLGVARGALGYYPSVGTDIAVYGFGAPHFNGAFGGRLSNENYIDTTIGLGIYGGVVGGWIKGNQYGTLLTGKRFASYNMGKTITNESFIVLDKKEDGTKNVSYAATSLTKDIQIKGVGSLNNGEARIVFENNFSEIIDTNKPIIITITPVGECNGVHIVSNDINGFTIKENQKGNSNVRFNWIAIAEKKSNNEEKVSEEILTASFDKDMDGVMHNDELDGGRAVWTENGEVKFGDVAPMSTTKLENMKKIESMQRQGERTPRKENLRAAQIKEEMAKRAAMEKK
jgi:hypothetical protein